MFFIKYMLTIISAFIILVVLDSRGYIDMCSIVKSGKIQVQKQFPSLTKSNSI